MDNIEMHALISGKVQGVGFRYTALSYANSLQLVGTVRNLPNGQVEIYAQGPKEDLNKLIHLLEIHGSPIKITNVNSKFYTVQKKFENFYIEK